MNKKNRAIFLDRDGTINIEKNYLHKIEDFEWIKGTKEAIKIFNNLGYKVIIVTNQSGVARGYYKEEDVEILNIYMKEEIEKKGGNIDKIYFCPHHVDGIGKYKKQCKNRKPEIGFFLDAKDKFNIDFVNSFIVGDKISDLEAAIRLGMNPILVETGYGEKTKKEIYFKTKIYKDLYEFALNLKKNIESKKTKKEENVLLK
ncbi:D-glycero-beta-D-manno-heptose 1,7-bisphosphate 7-phosphatase [Haliovirga abyssi]|uniref:D,D-heptose 1,7-bisphosphate phosphatase n=1 Tax=Haliovirga abyssi TaxID=2996794 RepID=A0AAU9DIH5_9FUSO|nr:D-glycero-beta-D-manno-heptose 1,7-bisphosphate 7-phosphatase [Haliovirga abyssi]BDU49587.1 D-glycero-alpha-D-manno-heptose-1,7-bisphosphate 7-phosphatase [Haliovirga abyssi]